MITPPDPSFELLQRINQRLLQEKVDNQLLEILEQAFKKVMDEEHILLSRPERIRLSRQVSKSVLTEALAKLDRDN